MRYDKHIRQQRMLESLEALKGTLMSEYPCPQHPALVARLIAIETSVDNLRNELVAGQHSIAQKLDETCHELTQAQVKVGELNGQQQIIRELTTGNLHAVQADVGSMTAGKVRALEIGQADKLSRKDLWQLIGLGAMGLFFILDMIFRHLAAKP